MTADVGTFPRLAKIIPEGWRGRYPTRPSAFQQQEQGNGLVNEIFDSHEALLDGVMKLPKKSPLILHWR